MMDIKKMIDDVVSKLKNDPSAVRGFQSDPAGMIEKLTGFKLPKEQLTAVIEGIKAKINLDEIAGKLGGLGGIVDMFNKK